MQLLCLEMSGVLVNVATLISDKLTSSISVMKGAPKTTPPLSSKYHVPASLRTERYSYPLWGGLREIALSLTR